RGTHTLWRKLRQRGYKRGSQLPPPLRPQLQHFALSMNLRPRVRTVALTVVALAVLACAMAGCRKKEAPAPPVATPTMTLSHEKAPLGSPLDIHYKFVVANDARFAEDYRVLVHVVDADDELISALHHNPHVPTSEWKPAQTVEYPKTVYIPIYPYAGEPSIQLGVHSPANPNRLALVGQVKRQR